jgi:hypothetical protein
VGFDKDYPNRKDRRAPYRGVKAADSHCRNHGACDYCANGHLHGWRKRLESAAQRVRDHLRGDES